MIVTLVQLSCLCFDCYVSARCLVFVLIVTLVRYDWGLYANTTPTAKKTSVNKRLDEQNNGFARAWQIVIHFFAVLGKTTT